MCIYCDIFTGNADYYPGPYNITFKAGETTVSFNVLIFDNDIVGVNKAFQLSIDSNTLPSGGNRYSPYSVTVTIQNDDCKFFNIKSTEIPYTYNKTFEGQNFHHLDSKW